MWPYLRWFLCIPASLCMAVVGRLLAPVLPFFVQDDGYLPRWLWWFQTPDNPCDGDDGHWDRHPGTDVWSTYKRRTAWFWRNVGYGFDIDVLGARCKAGDELVMTGEAHVGAKPCRPGVQVYKLYRDGKLKYWQVYFVFAYEWLPSRCCRGSLGWKLWDFEGKDVSCQWTGMVNPLFGTEE